MDFKQKLKALYKKNDKIAPLIEGLEGEIPQQTLDDYYVKLKTIIKEDDDKKQGNYETISGQKKEVEIEDIFDEPLIRRLLIIGGAGVGKSTLMQYMAYRWSTTNLWKDKFDYVYRVTLKTLLNVGWDRDYDKNEREDELKCLTHYNLIAQGEERTLKLKDMPWLEKKNKILILLDGYDEVAHERNGLYKGLFENIFKHENIILTSRPNAIDKQMAEKFGKKIENTGLDYQGIEKYLNQYFKKNQEKGETLQQFLDKNSSIKEICHIPVNIAMMCFIWSEGDSNQALHEISNMSDLYKQVVDHLGFRYYAKSNIQQNQDELMSKWKGGEIYLDELQVLEHTAYKGMTGGGLQVPEDKRLETLIIKGMTKKGDKDGISIQSSINYLRDQLKKDMPAINKVYKYGLLKPEGEIIDLKKNPKKELSETDLQEQSFSFIHLSFQEFLTALYLVQNLLKDNNKEEQERIANFIAQHRNEPRYLVTLKLMAGILSAYDEDHNEAEQGIKIFWDAILCNPDGVLELGVEAKITLLMHLFGQAKKDDTVDRRIPASNIAVDLIDSVILQDLTTWGPQLKESDYISPNIKEALIQFFIKDNKTWMSDMSSKLQEKFSKQIKTFHPITIEAVVEIISSIINKFPQDEQNQIFHKLAQLIRDHNETTWQFTKKALEVITIINQKSKLNLDDNDKKTLLDTFLITAYDSNLTDLSLKSMQEILKIKAEESSFTEKIKANIKDPQANIKAEIVIKTKAQLLKIINRDIQFLKDFIHTSLVPFLQDPIRDVRILASHTMTELVVSSADKQLILDVVNLLLPLIKDSEAKDSISDDIKILVNKGGHQKLIQDRINTLTPLLQNSDQTVVIATSSELGQLIKIRGNPIDTKLVSDVMKNLIEVISRSDDYKSNQNSLSAHIKGFIKATCQNDPQTAKTAIIIPTEHFKNRFVADLTWMTNMEILKAIDRDDIQFSKDIIDIMVSVLQNSKVDSSAFAKNHIEEIIKRNTELSKYAIETLTKLLKNSNPDVILMASNTMNYITRTDPRFAKDLVQISISLLKHSDVKIRQEMFYNIREITVRHLQKETQFTTDVVMKTLFPLFQNSDNDFKFYTLNSIIEIISLSPDYDVHFLRDFTKPIIPLLKDDNKRKAVAESFEKLIRVSKNWDTQLTRDIIKTLTPILQNPDSDSDVKVQVSENLIEIVDLDTNSDIQLRREVLNSLTPLLQDSNFLVKKRGMNRVAAIIKKCPPLCKDAVNILTPLLQDPDSEIRRKMINRLMEIIQIDPTLLRDVFNLLAQSLQDASQEVRESTSVYLIMLVEIAGNTDPQFPRDVFNLLLSFKILESDDPEKKKITLRGFAILASFNNGDIQFGKDIISLLAPSLQDKTDSIRQSAAFGITEVAKLIHNKDIEFIKGIIELLIPLANDSFPEIQREVGLDHIPELVELLDKTDTKLIQNSFEIALSCLQEPESEFRRRVPGKIAEFVQRVDVQLSRKAIEVLTFRWAG